MGGDPSEEMDRTSVRWPGAGEVENESQRSAISFESLIDIVADCAVFLDTEGHIQTWNKEAERIWGYASGEIIGEHFSVFFREADVKADVPNNLLREAAAEGRTREEGWQVREDGSEFWADVTLTALGDDDTFLGYAMITRDTTQHHREQILLEQNEQLEAFITEISHDLRNPLSVAQGNAELLRDTGDLSRVEKITEVLTRATELLDYLEQLATEGKRIQEPIRVDLREVAMAAWGVVEPDRADLAVKGNVTFMADRQRLQQLLENLFCNAAEHAGPGVTVSVGPLEEGGLYVEDDGPGIPEEQRSNIFEMGYTGDSDGSGSGLAICKQIAAAHGWFIEVTDGTDGGARFEVSGVVVA